MPIKVYKRGKTYHYRGTVDGIRLRGSTGTSDKKTAHRLAQEAERKIWRRHLDGAGADVTMALAFMIYRKAGKCDRFLILLEDYWKDTSVRDVTKGKIRALASKLYPNAKGATLNRQVIVPMQAVINHAAELDLCDSIKVKRFTKDTKTKVPATLEWITAFCVQAVADDLPHLAALALFMFGTGARRGEACAIRWADVDLTKKLATVNQTKIKDIRKPHLPNMVVAALANIPSNRNPDELVFSYASGESVGKVWTNVAKRAGIAPLTPHCCRHGFATTMLHKGFDPKTVAVRGGWKDAGTVLKHYAHAIEDITVTDALFDTNLTQDTHVNNLTNSNIKEISK